MAKRAEMDKVVRACKRQGLTYHGKQPNGHHLISNKAQVSDENGEVLPGEELIYVSIASTPRRDDAVRNAIARLRRELDFVWKGH